MAFTLMVGGTDMVAAGKVLYDSVTLKFNTLDFGLLDFVTGQLLTVQQQGFETDGSGYPTTNNCSVAQTAAQAHDGTHSLALTSTAAGDIRTETLNFIAIPTQTYAGTAWVRSAVSARSATLVLVWYKADGVTLSSIRANDISTPVTTSTAAWTQIPLVSAIPPSDAVFVAFRLRVQATAAGAEVHYFDTASFTGPSLPALGSAITTTDPTWGGTIAAITTSNPVDLRNGHQFVTVTATNTATLPNDTAPFDLSDVPVAFTDTYLLEDGSGNYLLESGTDYANGTTDSYLMEGALSYGYSDLSVRTQVNASGPNTTLGRATVRQPGLRPGNTVKVTSLNQGLVAASYQINQVTTTFGQGTNPPSPAFLVEFGDTPATLAAWAVANAAPIVIPPPPVVVPLGPVIFGQFNVTTGTYAMGGGIVTIGSATFSVSVPSGHTLTCQVIGQFLGHMIAWDNYIAVPRRAVRAVLSGGIFTGAWQELPFGLTPMSFDLGSAPGLAMAAGTYTVSIQIDTQEYNQMVVSAGWAQVAVTTV